MLVVSNKPSRGDTMMTATDHSSTTVHQDKARARSDLIGYMRTEMERLLNNMMSEDCGEQILASLHEKTTERETHRNGYRVRKLETQLGALELEIPKLRRGTYFPDFLEPHCRVHASLTQVVMEAYTQGISTRKMTDLAEALGMSGLSKSVTSRMLVDLDVGMREFCQRPLPPCPYVFIDARYERVHEHGRVVSKAVLVAVGVTLEGRRELLGYDVVASENDASWESFLAGLVERGLRGVRLVISDAHSSLRYAIPRVFTTASWQRCTIHLARNLAAAVGYRQRAEVATLLKLVLASPDITAARKQLAIVLPILHARHPKAAAILEAAGEDFIAYMHFPGAHWRKLHSTNLVERLNREIKRRTRVVSIFPSDGSLKNLVGAVLERFYITWAAKGYMDRESLRLYLDPLAAVRHELETKQAS
jgi:transposase-like protein